MVFALSGERGGKKKKNAVARYNIAVPREKWKGIFSSHTKGKGCVGRKRIPLLFKNQEAGTPHKRFACGRCRGRREEFIGKEWRREVLKKKERGEKGALPEASRKKLETTAEWKLA